MRRQDSKDGIALRRATLLQPSRLFKAMPTCCALKGSEHFAICGARTARMDRTSTCSLLQPLRPIQSLADFLCTQRLGAFRNMRRQDCKDGPHFDVLAAAAIEAIQDHDRLPAH